MGGPDPAKVTQQLSSSSGSDPQPQSHPLTHLHACPGLLRSDRPLGHVADTAPGLPRDHVGTHSPSPLRGPGPGADLSHPQSVADVFWGSWRPWVRYPGFRLMSSMPWSLCTIAFLALIHHENSQSTGPGPRKASQLSMHPLAGHLGLSQLVGKVSYLYTPCASTRSSILSRTPTLRDAGPGQSQVPTHSFLSISSP